MKGGFDVEFVKEYPDDNVACSICLFVLRQPLQAIECGHRFCESCVADLKKGYHFCFSVIIESREKEIARLILPFLMSLYYQ